MSNSSIYGDIARRTGGDIYIGVVGPVRTGKSTFIQRFLETVVLPATEGEEERKRTLDEMPQSASGRTIMTTEPKFVPDEAVRISPEGGVSLNVKLIDCVGYIVDGALGAEEEGNQRMVRTPWSENEMPFAEAAELGTSKVIGEHSTIAMLVTTDGSIADIPRDNYIEAEERVARELSELGKPFAIILNSKNPESDGARALAEELEKKYGAPVALVSCPMLDADDVKEILSMVLKEFPVREIAFTLPEWCELLPKEHPLKAGILNEISEFSDKVAKLYDVERLAAESESFEVVSVNAGDGSAELSVPLPREKFLEVLSEYAGVAIEGERELLSLVGELSKTRDKYSKIESALRDVEEKGYGIVLPTAEELKLEEPSLIKQAGGWGVKVTAHADSIHMIKTGIRADLCPVVGSAEQSEEVVKFLTEEYEEDPKRMLEYNMFGKSLYDMVSDGMNAKLQHMPSDSRDKLGQTLGRIINEGAGGLICILL